MMARLGGRSFLLLLASTVALFVAFGATPALAQKDMGTIVGAVKDSTGAVVAGANVTVADVERGTSFHTKTNDTGEYVAGPLRIGQYTVTVEKTGFKKAVAGPVPLNVQDRLAEITPEWEAAAQKLADFDAVVTET